MNNTNHNEELDPTLQQDLAVLSQGISEDALRILEARYAYNSTIYDHDAMTSELSNDILMRQAFIKEGQRQVLGFIRYALNHK
jgi:hypothetical protein